MTVASMVIGILGAVVTFFIAIGMVLLGGLGDYVGVEGSGMVVIVGWLTVLASIAALVGAILAKNNPKVGAIMMIASALPGILLMFVSDAPIYLGFGSLLLIIGGVLAFVAFNQEQPQSEPTT